MRVVGALRRLWWLVVALAVAGAGVAFGLSASSTPIFQSTASLYFTLNQGGDAIDLNQGSTYTQNQMLSFAQLATSSRVLQPVIDDLDLHTTPRQLARTLQVSIPQSTVVLEVQASSPDPRMAARVANAVTTSLVDVVREIAPTSADSTPTVKAEVIDRAVVPRVQALPNKTRDAAIGLLIGFLLGVLIAIAVTALDTRIRSADALARVLDRPVIGTMSRAPRRARGRAVDRDPLGQAAEDARRVRSSLAYASLSRPLRTLLITSALPGDGKTTVAANLAYAMSGASSVLIVDADLRRPRVAEYLGVEGSVGLTDVLLGEVPLERAKLRWSDSDLDILASGPVPPNPADVLTSAAMRGLLESGLAAYDVVIVDSPPVLSVADAALLSPLVDGVVVVIDARRTRQSQAVQAVRELESAGARVVGVILNNVKIPRVARSHYYARTATAVEDES
jgi:capsular exopolysaccharide synthesis family protein